MSKSGGDFTSRLTLSEPRRMNSGPRYDLDDLSSLGSSVRNDERPNNWDIFDWRPQYDTAISGMKGVKKGNPEREKEREIDMCRDRSPSGRRQNRPRYYQPATFPRTRDTPLLTAAQQRALDSIKQHLSFSDNEEVGSIDDEPNNERYMPSMVHRHRQHSGSTVTNTFPSSEFASVRNQAAAAAGPTNTSIDKYTNSLKDEMVDSNQIVARLMQIRDYIKQASTMKNTLQRSQDSTDLNRAEQLEQVISRLKEQENKYLDLLLHLDHVNNGFDQSSSASLTVPALPEQYMNNADRTDLGIDLTAESDASGNITVDLDIPSECSDNQDLTSPAPVVYNHRTDEATVPSIRPQIEDHLGRHSDTETEPPDSARSRQSSLAVTAGLEPATTINAAAVIGRKNMLENDLTEKNDELEALQLQHDLLKKMLHQQEELRVLEARQSDLLELQQNAERQLSEEKTRLSQAKDAHKASRRSTTKMMSVVARALSPVDVGQATASDSTMSATDADVINTELGDLRHRLDALKQAYTIPEQSDTGTVGESEMSTETTEEHRQLRDKLCNLKEKKFQIDNLLQELYTMREQQPGARPKQQTARINNDIDDSSATSSQIHIRDSINTKAVANSTANKAQDMLVVMESNKKLKKLHDVRGRLDQLRDLVQYYQHSTEFIHGESGTVTEDEDEIQQIVANPTKREDKSDLSCKEPFSRKLLAHGLLTGGESSTQIDTSDVDSQSSSIDIAKWGEDTEIQQKVGKLKAAKLKLHRLQELVGMVQQGSLPSELAAITASLEDDEEEMDDTEAGLTGATGETEQEALNRRVEREVDALRKSYYEEKWQTQQQELNEVVRERNRLLAIQQQLKDFHQQSLPQILDASESGICPQLTDCALENGVEEVTESDSTLPKTLRNSPPHAPQHTQQTQNNSSNAETAQVTFQEPLETVVSCDELYGRMRQQRILREELREKKKELELMMRKDRPRKHYSRNQDNQSDNVSYSNKSDAFGASLISGDVTVATWGGSTADNLESIEENQSSNGHEQNQQHVSDGYPSDGIVQVEEEEEADVESDRNTYTIDDDYSRHMRLQRIRHSVNNVGGLIVDDQLPPMMSPSAQALNRRRSREASGDLDGVDNNSTNGGESSTGAAAPFVLGQDNMQRSRPFWEREKKVVLNNARSKRIRSKPNHAHLNESVDVQQSLLSLRQELISTKTMVHNLQASMGGAPGLVSPSTGVLSQQQLQQQQLIFNVNQCYSQLMFQQQELMQLRRRMDKVPESPQSRPSPRLDYTSLLTTGSPPAHRSLLVQQQAPYWTAGDDEPRVVTAGLGSDGSVVVNDLENNGNGTRNMYDNSRGGVYDRNRDVDQVPIHTVQAADTARLIHTVPKLNLQQVDNRLGKRGNLQVETNSDTVITRNFSSDTPARAMAASSLAGQQQRCNSTNDSNMPILYRPGMSADISGTVGLGQDTASVSSAISSVPCFIPTRPDLRERVDTSAGVGSTDPLFEALRETIYAEVATLISQNENRPHFLIELFRELQMLVSDYLRQRALYAIQDLVTRHLTDNDLSRVRSAKRGFTNNKEQTPSESLVTSDDEHIRAHTHVSNLRSQSCSKKRSVSGPPQSSHLTQHVNNSTTATSTTASHGACVQEVFDYTEPAEDTSSMSTPNSYWDHPFLKDSLGDTVIHLDQAMRRMREYEGRLSELEKERIDTKNKEASDANNPSSLPDTTSEAASSSAQDKGNESDASDIPYSRIDTAQLDAQVKAIMAEVLPVLSEHVDDVCSPALLSYLQRLLLALSRQPQQTHEFVRFFHKQLGSILHDSLAKFEGKKLRECREDLVVDLAEILFNELAFFRLMQGLEPNSMMKSNAKQWRQGSQTSTETDMQQSQASCSQPSELTDDEGGGLDEGEETTTAGESDESSSAQMDEDTGSESSVESKEGDTTTIPNTQVDSDNADTNVSSTRGQQDESNSKEQSHEELNKHHDKDQHEHENLGKDRDDELACCVNITDDIHASGFKFELAVSETKPFTRIGSDEDDCDETSILSGAEDLSESAVARDACKEAAEAVAAMTTIDSPNQNASSSEETTNESDSAGSETPDKSTDGDDHETAVENGFVKLVDNKDNGINHSESQESVARINGTVEYGQTSDEITLDDLPEKLSGLEQLTSNAHVRSAKVDSEEACNDVISVVLNDTELQLVGDPQAILEPTGEE